MHDTGDFFLRARTYVCALCRYIFSALSNTLSKDCLNALPSPVTLTLFQFGSISLLCWMMIHFLNFPADPVRMSLLKKAALLTGGNVVRCRNIAAHTLAHTRTRSQGVYCGVFPLCRR